MDYKTSCSYHEPIQLAGKPYSSRETPGRHCGVWYSMHARDSKASLSNSGDKLVAMASIATSFTLLLRDTYVAVTWRSYLPEELLSKAMVQSKRTRPAIYRAPT
jgi:hypothetical protein